MKNKKINIGLIWANPYTGNLGVTALAYSTLFLFEKIAEIKNIKFRYLIITSKGPKHDTFQIGQYKVDVEIHNWNYNGNFKSFLKLITINLYQIFNLSRLDIAFDIGAGDSFSDIYGIRRFREINGIKWVLRKLGKKIVLLPQTYGPYNSPEAKTKAIRSIRNAKLLLARDLQSYHYVKSLVPEQEIFESIDVAFFMPYKAINLNNNSKYKIGINISGLLWNGGYTKDNQFHLKTEYQGLMKEILQYFSNKSNVEIYLVAHVLLDDFNNIENDYKICCELNGDFPNTILAPFFTNPIEAKSFISSLNFFTGARMHSCIAAFSSGVPVFPLAYSRKFNGLFKETLNYKYYGDLVNSEKSKILNDLDFAYNNIHKLKENINTSQIRIKQMEIDLINCLSNVIPYPE